MLCTMLIMTSSATTMGVQKPVTVDITNQKQEKLFSVDTCSEITVPHEFQSLQSLTTEKPPLIKKEISGVSLLTDESEPYSHEIEMKKKSTFADLNQYVLDQQSDSVESSLYVPGEIIIKFSTTITPSIRKSKDNIVRSGIASIDELNTKYTITAMEPVFKNLNNNDEISKQMSHVFKLTTSTEKDIFSVVQAYQNDPNIVYAQPNYIMSAYLTPDDPYYSSSGSWGQNFLDMWGLHRIEADRAWDVTTGSHDVVVAVVDTGVDYNHPDIHQNMWVNPGEDLNGNGIVDPEEIDGIDNDGDGFTDNFYGVDFAPGCGCGGGSCPLPDGDPMDEFGHGTHCAGIIAAIGNNNLGVVGVNWHTKIMAAKGLTSKGSGSSEQLAAALLWAAQHGADVISNSWGFGVRMPADPLIEDAVRSAYTIGCVVVFAAGNSHDDVQYYSPQNMDEVISVAAIDVNDQQTRFTSWGEQVTVCAPGVDVLSLRANGTDMYGDGTHIVGEQYYRSSGTSMACPHVAGLAALLLSYNPDLTPAMIKTILKETGDRVDSRRPIGTLINAADALSGQKAAIAWLDIPDWADMKGVVEIAGTAGGASFESYTLEYGEGYEPLTWNMIASSMTPVVEGALASFDVMSLAEGTYILRLQVFYGGGLVKTMKHMIVVNNEHNVYIVNGESPCIQDAILVSGKDDVISVQEGVYKEQLVIDRPVQLLGANPEATILDGDNIAHIIVFVATDGATIQGFTIQNSGPAVNPSWFDSGILIYGDGNTISGNKLSDTGVGIALFVASQNTLSDNKIQPFFGGCSIHPNVALGNIIQGNMEVNGDGIGIYLLSADENTLEGNELQGSGSIESGGITIYYGCLNNIVQNNIINHYGYGLSIALWSMGHLVTGNIISKNTYYGTFLAIGADNNIFADNCYLFNTQYGVFIPMDLNGATGGHYNLFYHNDFIFNGINAEDYSPNTWNTSYPVGGNFWSDFDEPSEGAFDEFSGTLQNISGSDGIVDLGPPAGGRNPYRIPGSNRDRYPLIAPCTTDDFYVWAFGPYDACINEEIQFNGSEVNGVASFNWSWEFGDGTISYLQNPCHTYTKQGTYAVNLTVTDSVGNSAIDTTTAYIYKNPFNAWANFPSKGIWNTSIYFTGYIIGGVSPYAWYWDFGDGYYSDALNPVHRYVTLGTFNVTFTAFDAIGHRIDITRPIAIKMINVQLYGQSYGIVGNTIYYSGYVTGGVSPFSCTWDFGDGNVTTMTSDVPYLVGAAHVYETPGDYTVVLTVVDSQGNTDSDIDPITIDTMKTYTNGPYTKYIGQPVSLKGTMNGGFPPYTWTWDLGDGNITEVITSIPECSLTHLYSQPQIYHLALNVTDSHGFTANTTTIATIKPIDAGLSKPINGLAGNPTYMFGSVTGGFLPYTWTWDFGDGNTTTIVSSDAYCGVTHVYDAIGSYNVTLTVTDSHLFTDTDSAVATITPPYLSVYTQGPYFGVCGQPVQFKGAVYGGSKPFNWTWDFGDGNVSHLQNATNMFTSVGVYNITLTVIDRWGTSDSDTTQATIYGSYPIHNVDNDSYYLTIQQALDDADPGDTIVVAPGIYHQNLYIGKSIILKGENRDTTILDGSGSYGTIVEIYADEVTLTGFTIQNSLGAGVWTSSSHSNVITGNRLRNVGCGITLASSSGDLISENIIENMYYGMCFYEFSTDNVVRNNVISNGMYYGVFIEWTCAGNHIYHNNFINNSENAYDDGGYENNQWDNGYPSGGNYWSNYDEPSEGACDDLSGPDQNINGSDGISDTWYPSVQDRYPLMHRFVLGDMNVDGIVNMGDINPFVQALCDPALYQATYHLLSSVHGDINQDGSCDFGDINPFVALLCGS